MPKPFLARLPAYVIFNQLQLHPKLVLGKPRPEAAFHNRCYRLVEELGAREVPNVAAISVIPSHSQHFSVR
jgi:hypothetical protein